MTKLQRYHDKWLTDEMYLSSHQGEFPTVALLGFDRGKMNRTILTHAVTSLVPSTPRNGMRSIRGNDYTEIWRL
jgi:hypothetical protein